MTRSRQDKQEHTEDSLAGAAVPAIRERTGNIVVGIELAQDITDRIMVEEENRRHLNTQYVINTILQRSIENAPLDEILRYTIEQILSIPWLTLESKGGIFMAEEGSEKLLLKVQKGLDEYLQKACAVVPFGVCLCGRAAMSQEAQYAGIIDDRHDIGHDAMKPHGHYCVPIVFSGKTLGVMSLYLSEGHPRNESELEFLHTIANALAGVIQRKRMEKEQEKLIQELRDLVNKVSLSRQEWQETFDSITDMIYLTDMDFGIIKANRAFSDYYGKTPQGVLGEKCYALVYGKTAPEPDCPHTLAVAQGKQAAMEIASPDSGKTFHISVFPYYDSEGIPQGSISIMRDVTEKKEQDLRLTMSERLAALGQMASGIAHEINNPLASIHGCAEGLVRRIERERYDPEFFKNYLIIIQEEIMRCKGITTGMLSFVRKESFEKKNVDIHEIIKMTLEVIGFQGRLTRVTVIEDLQEGLPAVYGSDGELRQVFLAVMTNALDAMQDNGTLMLSSVKENGAIVMRITDTGPGIPSAHLNRIFDPFFTTKSDKGGTGLGLAIANKIVANHDGSILVTSEEGKGATFKIVLPSAQAR